MPAELEEVVIDRITGSQRKLNALRVLLDRFDAEQRKSGLLLQSLNQALSVRFAGVQVKTPIRVVQGGKSEILRV